MRAADVRRSARRVAVARVLLVLAFAMLSLRAVHLSVFDRKGAAQGDAQTLRTLTLPPARGHIVDREGADLALSVDAPSVYVIPAHVNDPAAAGRALARILRLDARRLGARLERGGGFQFVARWVTEEQEHRTGEIGLAGVGVVQEPRRVYPHRALAARLVGFANIDGRGVRGIEQQEDAWLRGTARRLPVERDGSGRLMLKSGAASSGTAGGDVALSIDVTLQADAERALAEAVSATGARGGVVLSMDPRSGEILSLAEAPSFDPNEFRTLDYASTGSSAHLAAFEAGSALKPFLVAAALENGAIDPQESIDCEQGAYRIPGKTIRDVRPHGVLDVTSVLRVSSNICAVKIASALGRSSHYAMLRRFGFGESTQSRFPDESAGVLRSWRRWQPVDHANIAFGQGVGVTAVQLAAATAVLANGGEWVRPRLVRARRAAEGPWQPTRPDVPRRVIARDTARQVVTMLESVVGPGGTGRRAALPGVRVAGKTGTAQKFDPETGSYTQDRFRAWFIGMVPAEEPRLVIVTQLDEPRRPHHTGGRAAAPLFARVAAAQLAHFGVHLEVPAQRPPTRTASRPASPPPVSAARTPAPAARKGPPAPSLRLASFHGRVLLPDMVGLSVREVMQITESSGLRVTVSGRGRAIRQDPPPGTIVARGRGVIHVWFSEGGRS